MSFAAKLDNHIRSNAIDQAVSRISAFEAELELLEAAGSSLPSHLERELCYLERLAKTNRTTSVRGGFDLRSSVENLQRRCHALPGDVTLSSGSDSLPSVREAVDISEDSSLDGLAAFLRPKQRTTEAVDEVQLLSAEGGLADELARFPMLAVPETDSTLIFRPWSDEDDAAESERERLAILEISQAAANFREFQGLLAQEIYSAQESLDQVEQNVGTAAEQAEGAVNLLSRTAEDAKRQELLAWLAPSLCFAVVGAGTVALAGPTGCVACVTKLAALRGAAVAGVSYLGARKLTTWQCHALNTAGQHLPRTFGGLPQAQVALLQEMGKEANRRLCSKLADRDSWTQPRMSYTGFKLGLVPWYRPSDARRGYAYSTSFQVKLTAHAAFQVLQWQSLTGSLDPGCKMVWSQPVGSNTFLRYLVFSICGLDRDFFCIAHCGRSNSDPGQDVDGE